MNGLSGADMLALTVAGLTPDEIARLDDLVACFVSPWDVVLWMEPPRNPDRYLDPDFWMANRNDEVKVGVPYLSELYVPTRVVVVWEVGKGVPFGCAVRELPHCLVAVEDSNDG